VKEKIGIKRLDHVCWVVHRLEDALPLLTELMGMRVCGRWQNEEQGYRGLTLEVPGGTLGRAGAQFELMEPLGEDSFLHRFLREYGPGLHHVTFEVEDVEAAAQAIRDYDIEPFRGVRRSEGWVETYIHPKDSGGVLFQFYTEEGHHEHEALE
jgi:methylmalonyl-CoA/ethylmalonyl-CoA epimerase